MSQPPADERFEWVEVAPPGRARTWILIGALLGFAWGASWEPPDLKGYGPSLVTAGYGIVAGALFAALTRIDRFRASAWAQRGYGVLAVLASFFLLPTARQVGLDEPLPLRMLFFATIWGVPRVVANVVVMFGLYPKAVVLVTLILSGAGVVAARRVEPARRWRVLWTVGAFGLALGVFALYTFKRGPDADRCAEVVAGPGTRLVAPNALWANVPGLAEARAYDAHPIGDGSRLIVSLKTPPSGFGALALVDRDAGTLLDVVSVTDGFDRPVEAPLFPERMSVRGDEVFALLLGQESWLAHAKVRGDAIEMQAAISIPGEANSVLAEPDSDRVWVFLAGADAMGIVELRGDPPRVTRQQSGPGTQFAFQYSDLSPDGDRIVVTTTGGPSIVRLDAEELVVTDRSRGTVPSFGVRHDARTGRIYATTLVGPRVIAYDRSTLAVTRSVRLDTSGIADLDIDASARRMAVGGYTGRVEILTLPELESVRAEELGWMLRNVTADPVRHEVLASSGCGVFALDLEHAGSDGGPAAYPRAPSEEAWRLANVGLAHLEEDRLDQAEPIFRELAVLRPEDGMPPGNLGVTLLRANRLEEARASFEHARELGADPDRVAIGLSEIAEREDRADEATRALAARAEDPDASAGLRFRLARRLVTEGERDAARAQIEAALRDDPASLPLRVLLVETLLGQGTRTALEEVPAHLEHLRLQTAGWTDAADAQVQAALEALRTGRAGRARPAVAGLHNLLRPLPEYQAGLRRLLGRLDGVPGLPFPSLSGAPPREPEPEDGSVPLALRLGGAGIETERPAPIAVADLDGDGVNEVLSLSGRDGRLSCRRMGQDAAHPRACPEHLELGHAVSRVLAVDLGGDDRPELVAAGDGRLTLLAASGGPLVPVLELSDAALTDAVRAGDLDQDGDLDLVVAARDGLRLYRNDGETGFAREPTMLVRYDPPAEPTALELDDLDGDGDLDAIVASRGRGLLVHENLRQARFAAALPDLALAAVPASRALAVADHDGDGDADVFVGSGSGRDHRWLENDGAGRLAPDSRRTGLGAHLEGLVVHDARFLDLDNDGRLDLWAAGEDLRAARHLRVLRGLGGGRFEEATAWLPASAPVVHAADAIDADGDGDLDLWLTDERGRAQLVTNDGGNSNPWLDVRLVALARGSGKNNRDGIGAKIEIRAAERYQSRRVRGPVTHFGLGSAKRADVMRVTWPNGQPQIRTEPAPNQTLVEEEVLKGSCPFVYAWNGERMEFVTDLLWRSALGMPLGILGSSLSYGFADSAREHIALPRDALVPRDGAYELAITEELWESPYFDEVELIAVDHPAGAALYVDEQFRAPPDPPFEMHWVERAIPPVAARDGAGRDWLAEVATRDERYTGGLRPTRYQGIMEPHLLELDLGAEVAGRGDARLRLALVGWVFPTDASINVAVAQGGTHAVEHPALDVLGADGRWREVLPRFGFPAGKRKSVILELGDALAPGEHVVRVRTNMRIHWDHVFSVIGEVEMPVRRTALAPASADLHHRGFSALVRSGLDAPHLYDYQRVDPAPRWLDLEGRYTRYGDVAALLAEADDRYAILNAGDEMRLRFDAGALPPLPEGWVRDWLLWSDGWIKDGDLNTATGWSIEPLPHHGMDRYPYPAEQAPGAGTLEALDALNTRVVTREPYRGRLLEAATGSTARVPEASTTASASSASAPSTSRTMRAPGKR